MLKKIISSPHIILWSFLPVFLFMGLLNLDKTIDVNIHDTYFVIDFWICALLGFILVFFFGLWYWICKRFRLELLIWLSAFHALGTAVSLFIILYLAMVFDLNQNLPRRFVGNTYDIEIILGNIILFLMSQMAMVINSLVLLIRRIKLLMSKS